MSVHYGSCKSNFSICVIAKLVLGTVPGLAVTQKEPGSKQTQMLLDSFTEHKSKQ